MTIAQSLSKLGQTGVIGLATTSLLFAASAESMAQSAHSVNLVPTTAAQSRRLAQASTPGSLCPAQLGSAISRITNRAALAQVRWGIFIQTLGSPNTRKTLFARDATKLFVPASNNKLLTTAAVLQALGPQYRFRTVVYGNSTQPNLDTLRIIGHGDPSLTTAHLAALAQQLSQKGIRQVDQLIGDDTYFRGAATNPYWDAEDTLAGYGAPVNSLMLNQNAIGLTLVPQTVGQPLRVQWDDPTDTNTWRLSNRSVTVAATGSEYVDATRDPNQWIIRVSGQLRVGSASEPIAVSVPNPGNYLIQKLRSALADASITVNRATVVKATPAPLGEVELAVIESAPLSQLLMETNQESNNTYAEALLKTLGVTQSPNSPDATASGIVAVRTVLTALGVNPAGYSMVDGSGLTDHDRASPEALVQTLQAMAQSPAAAIFRDSLPVAGMSGTLKNRFRNTAAQGNLHAKTGTISGVVSLSGYLLQPNSPPIALSILANYGNGSTSDVRSAVDEIVLVLTRLRSC